MVSKLKFKTKTFMCESVLVLHPQSHMNNLNDSWTHTHKVLNPWNDILNNKQILRDCDNVATSS